MMIVVAIMMMPCIPTIVLYVWGLKKIAPGVDCSNRIMKAPIEPKKKSTNTVARYCMPTTLWSVV